MYGLYNEIISAVSMARMTFYHKELLVEFIELNRNMVRGKSRGDAAEAEECRRLWEEAATRLSAAGAVQRSGDEWKKAWGELLCRTKKMVRITARSRDAHKKLTPLDHRILAAGQGNLLLKQHNGNLSMTKLTAEAVKPERVFTTEMVPEDVSHDDDDDDAPLRPPPQVHNDDDRESGNLLVEGSPPSSPALNAKSKPPDPSLDTDIPKWLIDMEKARSRTEQKHADSASRQADAASKMAEAARIQAEALMRLAEASSVLAEAMTRIAKTLENRGN